MPRWLAIFPSALFLVLAPPAQARLCRVVLLPHGTGFNRFYSNTSHTDVWNPLNLSAWTSSRACGWIMSRTASGRKGWYPGFRRRWLSNGWNFRTPKGAGGQETQNPAKPRFCPTLEIRTAHRPQKPTRPRLHPLSQDLIRTGKSIGEDLLMLSGNGRSGLPGAD
jgi:hypothetical protein